MLNTKKLLYILPDVAYVVEVLPDKKPHSFVIQSFTQINGEFLDEEQFLVAKIGKLFTKLEAGEEYHLLLPDFLFATTIVTIPEKSDSKITEELNKNTLPQMGLTHDTHLIESAVLNEFRGISRVQLTAVEKSVITPLKVAAAETNVKVVGMSPISWVIKSLVSLEPSITVLQLGSHLYTAEQYIGVDQTTMADLDDLAVTIESIKTLKGSEPNIQTVYLLGNAVVEERLKTALSKTLPIQQMAIGGDSQDKIPSYIKHIIEYSARTLSIPDYPVPVFDLGKPSKEEVAAFEDIIAKGVEVPETDEEEALSSLPLPDAPVGVAKTTPAEVVKAVAESPKEEPADEPEAIEEPHKLSLTPPVEEESSKEEEEIAAADEEEKLVAAEQKEAAIAKSVEKLATAGTAAVVSVMAAEGGASAASAAHETEKIVEATVEAAVEVKKNGTPPEPVVPQKSENEDIDLRQFVQAQSKVEQRVVPEKPVVYTKPVPPVKTTIKNKSGVQHMLKMVFITLAVFCLTVGIGVGVGLAILKFSGSSDATANQTAEATATPTPAPTTVATPAPTPTATPAADAKPLNLKVLVVNATTKAGYAGTFKTKIEQAKLGTVATGNAKGKYTGGYSVYLKKSDPDVLKKFADATALDLTEDKNAADEDPQGKYDVVIVLAE